LDIRLLELFARESVTKLPEPCLERVAARVLSEHDHTPWNTDAVRGHDFIRYGVFEHAVLMDTGFMGKCIRSHDRFIDLDVLAGELAQHFARAIQFFRLYA